mmetsp:Transcript_7830/g.17192  ORF Transcript_7830/g.17192 Transcript_7830/m.17192 type:complete len:303 (+) Transcript_7830:39-947(+)
MMQVARETRAGLWLFMAVWVPMVLTTQAGDIEESLPRKEVDKTPYPCKEQYHEDDITLWVKQHLQGLPDSRERPSLLLLLGGSGAGKGTFIDRWKQTDASASADGKKIKDFAFHGLDEYLQYVPEFKLSVEDPNHVYKDAADACYGGAAIPAAKVANKEIVSRRIDTIYEETGKNVDRIKKRVLPPFQEGGYRITVVLVHNDADTAIERAQGRFQRTGRYAPEDYIRDTFKNNLESYMELKKMGVAEEFVYCDNFDNAIRCWEDDGEEKDSDIVPSAVLESGPAPAARGKESAAPTPKGGEL